MPKIFALRDRLLAVQEYLNDNEEGLEIFPEKSFSKDPRNPKYALPLVEAGPSCSLGENDNRIFGEELVAERTDFPSDDYIEKQCCDNQGNHNSAQDISKVTNPRLVDQFEVAIRLNQRKSAIETSKNENELPTINQEISTNSLSGKAY